MSVDGTDFRTLDWKPFDPARWSHKFNGAGLRYELCIAVATGWIVSLRGPYLCGSWPDLRIAEQWLHKVLPRGEYYIADAGYRCQHGPAVMHNDMPPHERRKHAIIRARHEMINGRLKEWRILTTIYRHDESMHGAVVATITIITQLEMQFGLRPILQIR